MTAVWILLGVLAVLAVAVLAVTAYFLRFAIGHPKPLDYTDKEALRGTSWGLCADELAETLRRVRATRSIRTVTTHGFDGAELHGDWISCGQPTERLMILFHGWHGSQYADFGLILEHYLDDLHADVLLAEQRAHGQSREPYTGFGIWERHDCVSWADYAVRECGENVRILLGGISMGATTVMLASAYDLPHVKGIVADCGFTSPWEEFAHVLRSRHLPVFPVLPLADVLCRLKAHYGLKEVSAPDALRRATLPMLFLHGTADRFVPCEMGKRNFEACASADKELLLVEGAGHGQSYPVDRARVRAALDAFVTRIGL